MSEAETSIQVCRIKLFMNEISLGPLKQRTILAGPSLTDTPKHEKHSLLYYLFIQRKHLENKTEAFLEHFLTYNKRNERQLHHHEYMRVQTCIKVLVVDSKGDLLATKGLVCMFVAVYTDPYTEEECKEEKRRNFKNYFCL